MGGGEAVAEFDRRPFELGAPPPVEADGQPALAFHHQAGKRGVGLVPCGLHGADPGLRFRSNRHRRPVEAFDAVLAAQDEPVDRERLPQEG